MVKLYFNKVISWCLSLVVEYPASKGLSYFWNGGSFLGMVCVVQIYTGILLVLFYSPSVSLSFLSVDYLSRESFWGFVFRVFHLNGSSLFFLALYLHLARGLIYYSFRLMKVWLSGVTIILVTMIVAFLGYVLPWGQMSFWGATVITNLVSVVPYVGQELVYWMWGGFSVGGASLSFFFLMHFLLPFVILGLVTFHLIFLHESGSSSGLMVHESFSKIKFHPYYVYKDIVNVCILFFIFGISFFAPWSLGDPENWVPANPMSSPVHIQPEWYFLYAYAILRAVPNKLGGVVALAMSVVGLYFLPFLTSYGSPSSKILRFVCSWFLGVSIILTWLGSCPVEPPYIMLSQICSIIFFILMFLFCFQEM